MLFKVKFINLLYFFSFFFILSFVYLLPNTFIFYIITLNVILYFLIIITYQNFITRNILIKKDNISVQIALLDNLKNKNMKLSTTIDNSIEKLFRVSFSDEFLEKQIVLTKLTNDVFLLEKSFAMTNYLNNLLKAETILFKTLSQNLLRKEITH